MTDKEKAWAYDGALNRAKAAIDNAADKDLVKGIVTTIFPLLRESEDERMRKMLIDRVRSAEELTDELREWILTYLKKQKEQKPAEWSEEDEKKITFLERLIRYNVPEGQYGWVDGQREVDFKIEERKWVHNAVDNIFPEDRDFMSEVDFRKILKDTARYFYKLGLNAKKIE